MPEQGRFIVFEGLDCSGSTTQANLLYQRLMGERRRVWITSEPSSGPVGHLIRLFFSGRVILPQDPVVRDRQFAYLFAADRYDHLYNPTVGILKFLREGIDVISTRYVLSSFAYNAESIEEEPFIRGLNVGFPDPDYLVYLDCPVSVSIERISASRPNRDTYENRAHLTRAASNYEHVLSQYSSPLLRIDAREPKKEIAKKVFKFISERDASIGRSNSTLSRQSQ